MQYISKQSCCIRLNKLWMTWSDLCGMWCNFLKLHKVLCFRGIYTHGCPFLCFSVCCEFISPCVGVCSLLFLPRHYLSIFTKPIYHLASMYVRNTAVKGWQLWSLKGFFCNTCNHFKHCNNFISEYHWNLLAYTRYLSLSVIAEYFTALQSFMSSWSLALKVIFQMDLAVFYSLNVKLCHLMTDWQQLCLQRQRANLVKSQ